MTQDEEDRKAYPILAEFVDDLEAYLNRYKINSTLTDPITNISVQVCRRSETHYREKKHSYLNINRIPLEFANTLTKGYPLILTKNKETFFLSVFRDYPPAKTWKNITCKVLNTLEYSELVEKHHEAIPKA